jgi:hypothetical protein
MDGPAARLELSIDVGSDPIRGSLIVDAGARQPFCGWMELTAAIEAARERGEPGCGDEPGAGETLGWVPGANRRREG